MYSFLKTVLRKNRKGRLQGVIFLLLFSPLALPAQPVLNLEEVSRGNFLVNFRKDPEGEEARRILVSVGRGMTSEVRYEIRVIRTGSEGGMGRGQVYSDTPSFTGYLDLFTGYYVISSGEKSRLFSGGAPFIKDLFSLDGYRLDLSVLPPGRYELRIRAVSRDIKLLPPLNFLAPLQALKSIRIPWTTEIINLREDTQK